MGQQISRGAPLQRVRRRFNHTRPFAAGVHGLDRDVQQDSCFWTLAGFGMPGRLRGNVSLEAEVGGVLVACSAARYDTD